MLRLRTSLMASAAIALVTASAYAASSGSFTAAVDNANCTIDSGTGVISPPASPSRSRSTRSRFRYRAAAAPH